MQKPVITELLIDHITELDELKKLLPEVDDDAKKRLEDLIEKEGIREPLTLAHFDDKNILLDGHNRLRVAKKFGSMSVPAVFLDHIKDTTSAEIWMVDNQLAKRNMDTLERIKIILQLEPQLQAEARERQRAGGQGVGISTQAGKVRDIIATMAGKSSTIIRQAKQILDTKDESLIAIADKNISINRAYKLAKLTPEKREKKLAVILQKITEEEAGTDTEESTETIQIVNTVYKKVSDLSYLSDHNNRLVSIKNVNGKPQYFSAVHILGGDVYIEKFPETFTKHKARNIFCKEFDDRTYLTDDIYNETVHDITCLLDNIKTAKRITEDRREKGRKEYIDAHPEIAEEQEAIKLAKKEQAKADKLALKKANNDNALAEEVLKEKEAFTTVHPDYHKFYLTLTKKKQKEIISAFYSTEHVSLVDSLNKYEFGNWLEKETKRLADAPEKERRRIAREARQAAEELENKTGIPAMTDEEKRLCREMLHEFRTREESDVTNEMFISEIETNTVDGLVFGSGKHYLNMVRSDLAKAEAKKTAKADAPKTPVNAEEQIDTPTHAPAPKKVAKKKADKKPAEPDNVPEPQAVASKNKRAVSKQAGKKSK